MSQRILSIFWMILPLYLWAAPPDSVWVDSLANAYPFLQMSGNVVHNAQALDPVFKKMESLEKNGHTRVSVLQVGDSHIQAGPFSERMRRSLQARYSAAGRGLVFPYRLAGTNGPDDLAMQSNVRWQARRNVIRSHDMPTGISGIGMRAADDTIILKVGLKTASDTVDYFDRLVVFLNPGDSQYSLRGMQHQDPMFMEKSALQTRQELYTVRKGDNLSSIAVRNKTTVAKLKSINNLRSDRIYLGQKLMVDRREQVNPRIDLQGFDALGQISGHASGMAGIWQIDFPHPQSHCFLMFTKESTSPAALTLHGLSMERRDVAGLQYHMSGVNGAQFQSFLNSEHFFQQLRALAPDWIILSLGTNESMEPAFDSLAFRQVLNAFADSLQVLPSQPAVLLTLPGDNLLRRRHLNPRIEVIGAMLTSVAVEKGWAWWDLNAVMGGPGSMKHWYQAGLASPDRLHFNRKGYELQADLLLRALNMSYQRKGNELE